MSDWRAAWRNHYNDGPLLVNTLCVHEDHGVSVESPDAGEVAGAIDAWLTDKFRFVYPNSVTLDDLTVTELLVDHPRQSVVTTGSNGGITAGSQLPREMCRVMKLATDVATRSGRGRLFLPTPQTTASLSTAELYVTSGTWFTNLQDLQSTLLAGHDFSYGTLGGFTAHLSARVFSRRHLETYDVTAAPIRNQVHWLRSRSTTP